MRCCAPDPTGGANSGPTELLTGFFGRGKEGVRGERKEKEVKGEKKGTKGREGGGMEREEFCAFASILSLN